MIYAFIRTTGESGYMSERIGCLSVIRLHPEEILGRQYSLNSGRTKHKKRRNDLSGSNLIKRGFAKENFKAEQNKILFYLPSILHISISGLVSKHTNW